MNNQLEKIGLEKLNENAASTDALQIGKFEKLLKISLPEDYKNFLEKYGNTMTFSQEVQYKPLEKSAWTKKNGYAGFELFYGLEKDDNNLIERMKTFKKRIPESFIPIAEAPGGNQILLGVKKDDQYGKVYFWDHESRGTNKDDIYLIAASFNDFVKSFELDQ